MNSKKQKYHSILKKYLPEDYIDVIIELLISHPVLFKISKPRKTKLGDFRASATGKHRITINSNLNPFSFLITTIHEFAHLIAYDEYGWKVKPHGKEWQNIYSKMIYPLIEKGKLPEDISRVLLNSLINVKASSCTDLKLQRVLLSYDEIEDDFILLEKLDKNSTFALNGKVFQKGILRRTRYMCMENSTQRTYLVNALAKVKEIKDEK